MNSKTRESNAILRAIFFLDLMILYVLFRATFAILVLLAALAFDNALPPPVSSARAGRGAVIVVAGPNIC